MFRPLIVLARWAEHQSRSGTPVATAAGRDIYAVTAPLVVEAAVGILAGEGAETGLASAGARFDPDDFLGSLAPHALVFGPAETV